MALRIVGPGQWRTQAWKNGGGVTHEVARADDAAGMCWRLSVAEVTRAGPFSTFPGIDRQIALLSGRGFSLRHADGRGVAVDEPLQPYGFAGEEKITCELSSGAVRDLNVMTRRGLLAPEVRRLQLGAEPVALAPGVEQLLFVGAGTAALAHGGAERALGAEHCAWLDASDESAWVCAVTPEALALWVGLWRVQPRPEPSCVSA